MMAAETILRFRLGNRSACLIIPGRKMRACKVISAVVLFVGSTSLPAGALGAGLNFEGVPLSPGATVEVSVPLSAQEKAYVGEGGNAVPPYTIATIAVPPGFDPKKSWPVLVAFSSTDSQRQNRDALKFHY